MKKRVMRWGLIALMALWHFANAQKGIINAEYFYDTDPGIGNGQHIGVTTPADSVNLDLSIPTTGLSSGFHNLFIRFQSDSGTWGLYEGRQFYLIPAGGINNAALINGAEYFYDTDPGIGSGTAINVTTATDSANLNLSISTSTLSPGFHQLFIRFRYNNGSWGLYEGRQFYILPAGNLANTALINTAEYFYDTDPGVGSGTAITITAPADSANLNLSISTNGLASGFHQLFIRFRYNNGTWGLYEGRQFYILPTGNLANAALINAAEYFYDADPGVGNGTAISLPTATDSANLNLNISTSTLASGFHQLFIRFRYNNGNWGLYEGRAFYILPAGSINNTALISGAEYFYDTDPGIGNGTAVTVPSAADSMNLTLNISTSSLSSGFHQLFIRFRYNNGNWGLYEGRAFYLLPSSVTNSAHINQAEYFYDTDPGVGNGTTLTVGTATDTARLTLLLSTSGLSAGMHSLFMRFRYDNGTWGLYEGRQFYIMPSSLVNTAHINEAEYFFDTDPGVGNGTPVAVIPASDTANLMLSNVSTEGLARGTHNLFFRFRYDNGTWGLYQGASFHNCTPPTDTITANGPTLFCFGDSVRLSSNTSTIFTYQWQLNGTNITGAKGSTYSVRDSSGNYAIVITDTSGCYNTSNIIPVTVAQPVSYSYNAAICSGSTYTFGSQVLDTAGVYHQMLTSSAGCDSTVNLTLSVSKTLTGGFTASICEGAGYFFSGKNLTASGNYYDTVPSVGGCDSIITLTLKVNNPTTTNISASICNGGSYNFNGKTLTTADTYTDTLTSVQGCDSFVILNLAVNQPAATTINAGICIGGSYLFKGRQLTTPGTYYDTLTATNTCDSIVTLNLQVNSLIKINLDASICQGASYPFKNQNLMVSGVYADTLTAQGGCDSVVILTLAVNPLPAVSLNEMNDTTLCSTSSVFTLIGGAPAGGKYSVDGVTATSFNPSAVSIGTHIIAYTFTDSNICSNTAYDTIIVAVCTGLNESDLANSISIYPNPASETVVANSKLFAGNIQPKVYNAMGQVISISYKQQNAQIVFNTTSLAAGLYSIQFNVNGGLVNKQFIKAE